MIRIPNEIDRLILDSKRDIRLEQESRKVAAVCPVQKGKKSRKQNKNGTLSSEVSTDKCFSEVYSNKVQKQKRIDKKV